MRRLNIFFLLCIIINSVSFSQDEVGLVLSGGGTKGISYIGVIKALEENKIPIDYIVGTSVGGLVATLYGAGYSVDEMIALLSNNNFQDIFFGKTNSGLNLFYKNKHTIPTLLSLSFDVKKRLKFNFTPGIINASMLQLSLNQKFALLSHATNKDLDNLMVPIRIVTSNIVDRNYEYSNNVFLPDYMRATINIPFVYPGFKIDGKNYLDGGIYNNFPVSVMKKEFNPKHIIGVKVSDKVIQEYDDNSALESFRILFSNLIVNNSDYNLLDKKNDTYITPNVEKHRSFEFNNQYELIEEGYQATMAKMEEIKKKIKRRIPKEEVKKKRLHFQSNIKTNTPTGAVIETYQGPPSKYVRKILFPKGTPSFDYNTFLEGYNRLSSNSYFNNLDPKFLYDDKNNLYIHLKYNNHDKLKLNFGGMLSTNGLGFLYIGYKVNLLRRDFYTFYGNFFGGRFKNYIETGIKLFRPTKVPYNVELFLNAAWHDYLSLNYLSLTNENLTYFNSLEFNTGFKLNIPFLKEGKISPYFEYHLGKYTHSENIYSYNSSTDFVYVHFLEGFNTGLYYSKSTLNNPEYADKGFRTQIRAYYFNASHRYTTNARSNYIFPKKINQWIYYTYTFEKYFNFNTYIPLSLGLFFEGVYSGRKKLSKNVGEPFSQLTFLVSPHFTPFWDTEKTISSDYILPNYVAFGFKNIFNLSNKLQLRVENFFHNNYFEFNRETYENSHSINTAFIKNMTHSVGLSFVYTLPLFPISAGLFHYNKSQTSYYIKIGYSIGNKFRLK